MAGACDSVTRLLSPYVDDELSGPDRAVVEDHLRGCEACQARLTDLKATSAAMQAYFTARAEAADFSGFTARVMAQVRKEPVPLGTRLRLWWTELMAYHSTAIYSSFGAAAVAAAAVLFTVGRPAPNMATVIHSMNVTDPRYEPVVMHTEDGETVIMLVEHQDGAEDGDKANLKAVNPNKAQDQQPHGGNL